MRASPDWRNMRREDVWAAVGAALTFGPGFAQVFVERTIVLRILIVIMLAGAVTISHAWRIRVERLGH